MQYLSENNRALTLELSIDETYLVVRGLETLKEQLNQMREEGVRLGPEYDNEMRVASNLSRDLADFASLVEDSESADNSELVPTHYTSEIVSNLRG